MENNVKVTDPMFANVIATLSAKNNFYFTPNQLLYFVDNRLKKNNYMFSEILVLSYLVIRGFS